MTKAIVYKWSEVVQRLQVDSRWEQSAKLLSQSEQIHSITHQRLCQILDRAWNELSETSPNKSDLSNLLHEYYQHPVWLISSAFCESDQATINDRLAAVRLIAHVQPRKILDFGGGIGTVSRLCATTIPQKPELIDLVDITEFRHTIKQYLSDFPNIRILEKPDAPYDAIISTEVLEHLIDPIGAVVEINRWLRVGGAFAASWSFGPVIKCHLPQNFHLRRLMPWIIRSLGFGFYGFERRGSTVYGFVKHSEVTPAMLKQARFLELISRLPIPSDRLLLLMRGL
ncbi:methyltransferase domain-containing protein [Moorena sp. SIO3I6]|uniref:class I SAM-dependent methyltransferase n=1 Tax=Moorena sp. SIO3I6 TaxID=2607831 RepID=UPI0013FC1B75|nr:methyltransferase domain-containing protein [Moorena sp. SIO3I6]NEP25916.1 class I SAM-dependent methyltransferase [Moorena sp. SIO3I6]